MTKWTVQQFDELVAGLPQGAQKDVARLAGAGMDLTEAIEKVNGSNRFAFEGTRDGMGYVLVDNLCDGEVERFDFIPDGPTVARTLQGYHEAYPDGVRDDEPLEEEPAWTREAVEEALSRFIDTPVIRTRDFMELLITESESVSKANGNDLVEDTDVNQAINNILR